MGCNQHMLVFTFPEPLCPMRPDYFARELHCSSNSPPEHAGSVCVGFERAFEQISSSLCQYIARTVVIGMSTMNRRLAFDTSSKHRHIICTLYANQVFHY